MREFTIQSPPCLVQPRHSPSWTTLAGAGRTDFICQRDNYICVYCWQPKEILCADHVIPRKLGGKTSLDNLVTACNDCNALKRDKLPLDFIWMLAGRLAGVRI